MRPVALTGFGPVTPLGVGWEALLEGLAAGGDGFEGPLKTLDATAFPGLRAAECRAFDPGAILGATGLRNNDRVTKLLLASARLGLAHAGVKRDGQWLAHGPEKAGVVASTVYGSLESITELDRVARLEDPRYLNPGRFPNTVINSALGFVSIWEDLRALNATVTNGLCGPLDAVFTAGLYLHARRADVVLVGGADALSETLAVGFDANGVLCPPGGRYAPGEPGSEGVRLGEGSLLAVAERPESARARGATVLAAVTGYASVFEPPEAGALTSTRPEALLRAADAALADAGLRMDAVDAMLSQANGHPALDALDRCLWDRLPPEAAVVAPKARFGEALAASGALTLALAAGWFRGVAPGPSLRGDPTKTPRTVLVAIAGLHGNASALVLQRENTV
ncbi:MAG: hypothetical protein HY909_06455 [Deltaproteobacteria bacterium]|nr:hypothetical protein [Deltaproteobacteria bacterium]